MSISSTSTQSNRYATIHLNQLIIDLLMRDPTFQGHWLHAKWPTLGAVQCGEVTAAPPALFGEGQGGVVAVYLIKVPGDAALP